MQRIDVDPDKLHKDYTPAVHRLIEIGEPALNAVLELMAAEDELTRLRAQRVIEGVTMRMNGFDSAQGWSSRQQSDEWRRLWSLLGSLDYKAPLESRVESVKRWKEWLSGRTK